MFKIVKVKSAASLFELTDMFGSDAPIKRIFQIVLSQGCRSVLVESRYKDEIYKSEYDSFYSKLFKKYSSKTQRLHFFSAEISDKDIAKIGDFQAQYLGFCVLRPFETQKVSNAVIKPIEDQNCPKRFFILCKKDFPVEILINDKNTQRLTIKGFPFTQQDGQLCCCSHAALAAVDKFLSSKPRSVSEIAEYAALVPGIRRDVPTGGLDSVQISYVLKKMGYVPLIYQYGTDIHSPFPPERVIYHYMESGIPIILGIPTESSGHALIILGHSFEPDMWWALAQTNYYRRRPSGGPYHCSTTWIQNFIINDDNFGPYLTIPKEFIWAKASEALLIVVPLPPNVNIQGEDAEIYAHRMLSDKIILKWMKETARKDKTNSRLSQIFLQHQQNEDLVLRTCLISADEFKNNYPPAHLREFYSKIKMPEKIGVTEISIPELFCQSRLRVGEIIMDSTAGRIGHSFLVIHLPGVIVVRDVNTERWNYFPVHADEPSGHMIR